MAKYFTMSDERVMDVATAADLSPHYVEVICLSQDWAEGDEHQQWLDTAPVAEIASWVKAIWTDNAEDIR